MLNKYLITKQKHSFHLVDNSPLPFLTSLFLVLFIVPTSFYLHDFCFETWNTAQTDSQKMLAVGFFEYFRQELFIRLFVALFYYVILIWFTSILVESQNFHSKKVQAGLRLGMLLFIVSEIMFFFAFFWAFFHYSLNPSMLMGNMWPPYGTQHLDFLALPLVNTMLLLSSGMTMTFAHAYMLKNNQSAFSLLLNLTIILGICFLLCQAFEYKYGVKFSWRNSLYGSIFFLTTGFHGLHVTMGTTVLGYCSIRSFQKDFSFNADQHLGFEAAAWYWHFVDVVWLFLYMTMYWWGTAI